MDDWYKKVSAYEVRKLADSVSKKLWFSDRDAVSVSLAYKSTSMMQVDGECVKIGEEDEVHFAGPELRDMDDEFE